jgi:hypothetical protein
MNIHTFLRPRLRGARFEGHAIPLEFLKDLAVLQEMTIEVAKWQFTKSHPDRKRSPRGFTRGIELKLVGIDEGSAWLTIALCTAQPMLFPEGNQVYFEEARDAIVSAIDAAERGAEIRDYLPEQALSYFNRLGQSLQEGEAIEFSIPKHKQPARLTKATRRQLLLASSALRELTEETSVRGAIPEADQDKMTFEILLLDGRKIPAPIPNQLLGTVIEAFNGYGAGVRALLEGVGKFDRNERLQSFESIEHISILDPLDIPARLEELGRLGDGWLEGGGSALSAAGLAWLAQAFEHHYSDELPLPYLYPTEEGGIQLEWSIASHEITLEIDLETHAGEWHRLDRQTGKDVSGSWDLDNPEHWSTMIKDLQLVIAEGQES